MAQSPLMFSSQRNINHGVIKQERSSFKSNSGLTTTSNYQNDRKSDIYVHRFSRNPTTSFNNYSRTDWRSSGNHVQQHTYKHELSDYDARAQFVKKQFDSLNLNPKAVQMSSSIKFTRSIYKSPMFEKQQQMKAVQYYKPPPGPKLHKAFIFKPENKPIVDKLEETYWTKWKPTKDSPSRSFCPKTKGLYTENEKIEMPHTPVPETETKERGDSNEGIAIISQTSETADNCISIDPLVSEMTDAADEKYEKEIKVLNINENADVSLTDNSNNALMLMPESPSECEVTELKHTDSFILTSQKKSMEKSQYQQPKCIKLFKNPGYSTKGSTNYIKGGSYPLKSCLKKESKIGCLSGHSVVPVRSSIRRPGKANRFTT